MANENEKFWLFDKDKTSFDNIYLSSKKVVEIEQAAVSTPPEEVQLVSDRDGCNFVIIGRENPIEIKIHDTDVLRINNRILKHRLKFPPDLEMRYRIKTTNGGEPEQLFTMKGNRVIGAGYSRDEAEFDIDDLSVAELRIAYQKNLMYKTRLFVKDGSGWLQFNFYKKPTVSFVMIEREFKTAEEMNNYKLPERYAYLGAIDMAGANCFGDLMLASNPHLAEAQYAEFKARVR